MGFQALFLEKVFLLIMKYWCRLCVFFLLKIAIGVSEAQVLHFKDSVFGEGIPFVVVDKMDSKPIAISNLDGNLNVSDTAQFKKWVFFHPEYYFFFGKEAAHCQNLSLLFLVFSLPEKQRISACLE